MLSEKKIYHFYHAFADGENSMCTIEEHLENLIISSLAENLEKFYVGIVGAESNRKKVRNKLLSREIKLPFEIVVEANEGFEQVTLEKMREHAKYSDGYYLYAHSKSSVNNHSTNICWMYTMEYCNVFNWIEAISHLKLSDAVGCFWLTHEKYPKLIHWGHTTPNTNSFFAGNYWWSKAETLRELPLPDNSNRYMAEQWIGNKKDLKVYEILGGLPNKKNFDCGKKNFSCICARRKFIKRIRNLSLCLGFVAGFYFLFANLLA
jgi:hypothetical protein